MGKETEMSGENTALDANALCMDCGMCCSGTLFSYVSLKKDEHKNLDPSKFAIYEKSRGKFAFKQPCSCLSGNTCEAYLTRPSTCRNFFCILQRKVMNGSISLRDGRKIISATKSHAAYLRQSIHGPLHTPTPNINLRSFLDAYLEKAKAFKDDAPDLRAQKDYIHRIFEYVKLVDRFFQETSLLTRFASLVQRVNSNGPKD